MIIAFGVIISLRYGHVMIGYIEFGIIILALGAIQALREVWKVPSSIISFYYCCIYDTLSNGRVVSIGKLF